MVAPLKIDTWRSLEQHRGLVDQHKENQARLAVSYADYVTTGWGEFEPDYSFDFNCIFVDQPFVSEGTRVDEKTPLVAQQFPTCKVGVSRWRQDADGNYTGAWLWFKVMQIEYQVWRYSFPEEYAYYRIFHHVRFEGVALKALPAWVLDIS